MMPWEPSWRDTLRALVDADDADPAASEPAEVIDGGPWRGKPLNVWLARISIGADLWREHVRRSLVR